MKVKFIFISIFALTLVFFLPGCQKDKKDPGKAKGTFQELLPKDTFIVVNFKRPKDLLNKIPWSDFLKISDLAKGGSIAKLGLDITNVASFEKKGIDPSLPCGGGMITGNPVPNYAIWVGVRDFKKFVDFMKDRAKRLSSPYRKILVFEDKIDSLPCWVFGQKKDRPSFLCCLQGKFAIIYGTADPRGGDLKSSFKSNILSKKNRLKDSQNFRDTISAIGDTWDGYYYLDLNQVFSIMRKNMPAQMGVASMLPQEAGAFVIAGEIADDKLILYSYFKGNREYIKAQEGTGSMKDFIEKMPGKALAGCFANSNIELSWKMLKENINPLLSILPRFRVPGIPKVKTLDAALEMAEKGIKKELGIDVKIERTILNFQGNCGALLYTLPKSRSLDFNLIAAAKVNRKEEMADLLKNIFEAIKKKSPKAPMTEETLGNNKFYLVETKKIERKADLNLCLGVWGNYLTFASQKSFMKKIIDGNQGDVLSEIKDSETAEAIKSGAPIAGYIKISKLVRHSYRTARMMGAVDRDASKVLSFTDHLKELSWYCKIKGDGLYTKITLQADGNFFKQMFKEVESAMSK